MKLKIRGETRTNDELFSVFFFFYFQGAESVRDETRRRRARIHVKRPRIVFRNELGPVTKVQCSMIKDGQGCVRTSRGIKRTLLATAVRISWREARDCCPKEADTPDSQIAFAAAGFDVLVLVEKPGTKWKEGIHYCRVK